MSVTEEDRLRLRVRLNEVLGEREAAVLMESVPPVKYDELATKQDLGLLRDELRSDTSGLARELRAEMLELRAELKADIAQLDLRMAQQLRLTVLTHVGSMMGLAAFLSAFN